MRESVNWSTHPENEITIMQKLLSHISLRVREKQFEIFWKYIKPKKNFKVLDVGIRKDETLVDSNFFEKRYPFSERLTAISVEDVSTLSKKYPKIKFRKVLAGQRLPFPDKFFDIAVSWATIEHVGTRNQQKFFSKELFRVGKRIFITTPNKDFFYEPHSGLFFAHWLPQRYFSKICQFLGKGFWGRIENLNPLSPKDIIKILPKDKKIKMVLFKSLGFLPTHIIIRKK